MTDIIKIQQEIKTELSNKEVLNALVTTTFKGLAVPQVYLAVQEGMMRGFTFKDFLEKNIYAIPFRDGYSLVTSIDYARKIGMRSGVCGKSAPTYEEKDGKVISCTVTIKRQVSGVVGDYSATVFFAEFSTGRNLWTTKPRAMIAKVAEMHALRMACPEELSQAYSEEEVEKEIKVVNPITPAIDEPVSLIKSHIIFLLGKLGAKTDKENIPLEIKRLVSIELNQERETLVEIKSRLEALVKEKNENA